MSAGQLYGTLPSTCPPEHELPVSTSMTSDWFAASTNPFQHHYMTPFATAPLESQKWTPQATHAQFPDLSLGQYSSLGSALPVQQQFMVHAPNRPRSSPSTFGPAPESINWPQTNALGIQYDNDTMSSGNMLPPAAFEQFSTLNQLSAPNTPELRQPTPRRPYASIAPNSSMSTTPSSGKRKREDTAETGDLETMGRRRKRTASVNSADLSEDDRYLVKLKEDESLPWKEIATRFHTDKGKSFQVAALQMRYKRLREKFRIWEDQDVNALKLAHEYWQKYKWEIISQKMTEFGSPERWPARNCARKWQEMELMAASTIAAASSSIAATSLTHFSTSPIEAPVQYSFMPMQ